MSKKAKKSGGKDEGFIVEYIKELEHLKEVYLMYCRLGLAQSYCLPTIQNALSQKIVLNKLLLTSQKLKENDMHAILTTFRKYKYLQALCFWTTPLDDNMALSLMKWISIAQCNVTLNTLQFTDCQLNENSGTLIGKALKYLSNPIIQSISFDHNAIGSKGLHGIILGLLENPNFTRTESPMIIQSLSFKYCQINHDVDGLCLLLQQNRDVRELSLRGNVLKATGLYQLSMALRNNKKLISLDVCGNDIRGDPQQFDSILQWLNANTFLGSLLMNMNPLDTSACMGLLSVCKNRKERVLKKEDGVYALYVTVPERINRPLFQSFQDIESWALKARKKK